VLLALACGGGGKAVRPSGGDQSPPWLAEGTGAVRSEGSKKLQGVGVASGVADPKARRRQADAAARDQLQGAVDALARTLAKMSETFADVGVNILQANARSNGEQGAVSTFEIEIVDVKQLNDVVRAIGQIPGVHSVERM